MKRHRVKVSFVRIISDVHQLPPRVRIDRDLRIYFARVGGGDDERRMIEMPGVIHFSDDGDAALAFCLFQLPAHSRRDDLHAAAGVRERQRLSRAYRAAPNYHGVDALRVQCYREITHEEGHS